MTDRQNTAAALTDLLGETYALYLRAHGYHWNVEGPNFASLHALFEEDYRALFESLDEIAERIRALGAYAPMGGELRRIAARYAEDNEVPSANAMVQNLLSGHESWLEGARAALDVAEEAGDPATEGLLGELITAHEKTAWMLRSSLER
ncbi:Dps family protein [Parvularcula maris]|uniref:DNA starvation/stationary phase protection protein n=1 Tax=Parvularcula maris TaxID=2965077 RepID=A0A9X2L933_9PROT|nr:DNA starvation/stationary phase protection protein [Parvularcula maris]MCQ8185292.1 DNA starvation/stationary phase protection protein [Parvularcula maris]